MSLINQMLQELEQRQTTRGTVAAQVRAVDASHRSGFWRWVGWAVIGLLVASVLGAGVYYYQGREQRPIEIAVQVSPEQPAPVLVQPESPLETLPSVLQLASELGSVPTSGPLPVADSKLVIPGVAVSGNRQPSPANSTAKPIPPKEDAVINKEVRQLSARQRAENLYQQAYAGLQQGRLGEAEENLKQALQQDAGHAAARQALSALLIETRRMEQAEKVLQDGLSLQPENAAFAMTLARIQVERANLSGALATLQRYPPAVDNPEFHAFLAALLQKSEQHKGAIEHYQVALRYNPTAGSWLIGLGISYQADQQNTKALEAFQRAKQSNTLSPELQAFVDQKLRQLQ
ncbi:MAG: tetratricopeptide repeat protein [Sulfuricellaceae bacterium]|nr:tetratricopeptide repeat protein [Sulfuricellaceae bacterium]